MSRSLITLLFLLACGGGEPEIPCESIGYLCVDGHTFICRDWTEGSPVLTMRLHDVPGGCP